MAINNVELTTTFEQWRVITNAIITAVGDNTALSTTEKSNLVGALNEVLTKLGTVASLDTTEKSNVVGALNEVFSKLGTLSSLSTTEKGSAVGAINELDGEIGTLADLDTDFTTNLVGAINEIQQEILDTSDSIDLMVGDLDALNTTDKDSVVDAINEVVDSVSTVNGKVGDLATLDTTEQSDAVGAINEVAGEIGDISALSTVEKGSAVGAINELDGKVGDLATLDTTEKGSFVGAINEVVTSVATKAIPSNIPVANLETNHGRFSPDTVRALTTFDDTLVGMVEYNSAAFSEGEKFIDDNSDGGGAGGSLGVDALALVTALGGAGRADLRNGYEFYILDITVGGGTADGQTVTAIDYYPVISGNDSFLGPIGSTITYQFWVRLETLATPANNGVVLADSSVTTYVNGTEITPDELLEVADGWVHVRQTAVLTNEFKQFFPVIQANVGDVINIALPCMYQANVDNGIHVGVL